MNFVFIFAFIVWVMVIIASLSVNAFLLFRDLRVLTARRLAIQTMVSTSIIGIFIPVLVIIAGAPLEDLPCLTGHLFFIIVIGTICSYWMGKRAEKARERTERRLPEIQDVERSSERDG